METEFTELQKRCRSR